jgi:hypothetical protein
MAHTVRKWRRRTARQWQELLERQTASGQSIEAFCRSESITTASFYRWRKQLSQTQGAEQLDRGETSAPPPFLDLGALGECAGEGWELELLLGGGVVLRLRGG